MKKCNYCGKRHLGINLRARYWWRYLTDSSPLVRKYKNFSTGPGCYAVGTRYHESAGEIYCHECWPAYVRECGF